jgi:hypothetical protein
MSILLIEAFLFYFSSMCLTNIVVDAVGNSASELEDPGFNSLQGRQAVWTEVFRGFTQYF